MITPTLWAVRIKLNRTPHGRCSAQPRPQARPWTSSVNGSLVVPAAPGDLGVPFGFSSSVMTGVPLEEMFELAFLKVQPLQVTLHTCDVADLRV